MCGISAAGAATFMGLTTTQWATVGAVASVAGFGISAMSAMSQGQAASNAANYNAQVARNNAIIQQQNAEIARQQGEAEAAKQRRLSRLKLGQTRAAYGAAGVTIEGSPFDILDQEATDLILKEKEILYNAGLAERRYNIAANAEIGNVGLETARGASALSAGYTSAAGTLLSGAGKTAMMGGRLFAGPGASNAWGVSGATHDLGFGASGY